MHNPVFYRVAIWSTAKHSPFHCLAVILWSLALRAHECTRVCTAKVVWQRRQGNCKDQAAGAGLNEKSLHRPDPTKWTEIRRTSTKEAPDFLRIFGRRRRRCTAWRSGYKMRWNWTATVPAITKLGRCPAILGTKQDSFPSPLCDDKKYFLCPCYDCRCGTFVQYCRIHFK